VLSSAVVDVVIAVVLTFAVTAMAASAVVESIGNLTKKRAKFLLRGLRNMLDAAGDAPTPKAGAAAGPRSERALYEQALEPTDKDITALRQAPESVAGGLTAMVFDHPLLRSMMQPKQSPEATRSRVPPYVPAETFARALIDTLAPREGEPLALDQVRDAIEELDDSMPAKKALLALVDQARNDIGAFMTSLEKWYDDQMDRVSGWYKRWAKRWIIVVAALICIVGNVDGYAIARTLYADPVLRTAAVSEVQQGQACNAPGQRPEDRISCVRNLANTSVVLWPADCPRSLRVCVAPPGQTDPGAGDWLVKLLGLALTVAAAAAGAPFWFDTLNRLVNLRTTGKVPAPAT
jgi:hypothetical protein